MNRRGLTLPEVVVCFGIFSLLSLVALGTLVYGATGFHQVVYQQGSQNDVRRIMAALQRDLASTHHRSITVEKRQSVAGYARDAMALCSLDSWSDPANFDNYLRPRWNCYVVYYASREQNGVNEAGKLVRQVCYPRGTPVGAFEYATFISSPESLIRDGEPLQSDEVRSQILTDRLWKFELVDNPLTQSVSIRLSLRNPPQKRATGIERDLHSIEVLQEIKPANTWPQI